MKYTYSKLVKDNEKKVEKAELEVHAVKWMFFNSDFFCGYSHLNDEASQEVIDKFNHMIDLYINEKIPPQYILNKTFFFNYPMYVDEGCFIPRPETEQLVEETIYRIDEMFDVDAHKQIKKQPKQVKKFAGKKTFKKTTKKVVKRTFRKK